MIRLFLIYLPSTFIPRISALVAIVLGTRLLTASELGYFTLVTIIGEFADYSTSGWVRVALARFGAGQERVSRGLSQRIMATARRCGLSAVVVAVVAAAALASEDFYRVAIGATAYVLAMGVSRLGVALYQADQSHKIASGLEAIRSLLALSAAVAAMAATGSFLAACLASSGVTVAIGSAVLARALQRRSDSSAEAPSYKRLTTFALPLVAIALLSQVLVNLDKAVLKSYHSAEALAGYAVAFATSKAAFDVVAIALNTGAFVKMSAHFNRGERLLVPPLVTQQLAYFLAIGLPLAGALIATQHLVVQIMYPAHYARAFDVAIPLVVLGTIALNIKYCAYDNIFHLHLKNVMQIPTLIAGAAVATMTGLVVVPRDPTLGAALMFATGSITTLVASVVVTGSMLRVPVPWTSIASSAISGLLLWLMIRYVVLPVLGHVQPLLTLFVTGVLALCVTMVSAVASRIATSPRLNRIAFGFVTSAPIGTTGLSSYSESLLAAIAADPNAPAVMFLTNAAPETLPRLHGCEKIEWVQLWARPRWLPYKLYVLLAHDLACFRARIAGCTRYTSLTPSAAVLPVLKQAITVHDLYDLDVQYRPWRTTIYAKVVLRWFALVSWRVVCVSAATAEEMVRLAPFSAKKIVIVREASKFEVDPDPVYPRSGNFLFVANIQPVKNVVCLLEALRNSEGRTPMDWVGRDASGEVAAWLSSNGPLSGFNPIGSVSDEQLLKLYKQAQALVVTSWKEGFCLPVLEAHACGTPVIAADIPTLREVAGDGAIYFNPSRPEELLQAMEAIQRDALVSARLSVKAIENAQKYSWPKAAQQTLTLLGSAA